MRIRAHARHARQLVGDADDRPPFGEAGAHAVILREAIPQPVEPLGDGLLGGAGERLCAGIDLDAGNDALAREDLGERRPVGALLTDGLVIQDGAADELGRAWRGEQHLAVRAPALLGGLDPERYRTASSRWRRSRRPRECPCRRRPASPRRSPDPRSSCGPPDVLAVVRPLACAPLVGVTSWIVGRTIRFSLICIKVDVAATRRPRSFGASMCRWSSLLPYFSSRTRARRSQPFGQGPRSRTVSNAPSPGRPCLPSMTCWLTIYPHIRPILDESMAIDRVAATGRSSRRSLLLGARR